MPKKISFDNSYPRLPFDEYASDPAYSRQRPSVYPLKNSSDNAPEAYADPDSRLLYISFGSGSSGNSCFVGTRHCGVIIDAGVKHDVIEASLKKYGIAMRSVRALLLTHDHSDHVRYAYTLLRNNRHIRLMCTPMVLKGVLRRHSISKLIKDYHTEIFKEHPFEVGPLRITAFDVHHDGTDNMGFSISMGPHNFVLATDMGEITDRARHYMEQANYLVIESNYDINMLRLGRYPEYLKARIQTGIGHMDNRDTASFLASLYSPRLKYIFLCHLSKDNNTPQLAREASYNSLSGLQIKVGAGENTLADREADVQLVILPRYDATRLYSFIPDAGRPQ